MVNYENAPNSVGIISHEEHSERFSEKNSQRNSVENSERMSEKNDSVETSVSIEEQQPLTSGDISQNSTLPLQIPVAHDTHVSGHVPHSEHVQSLPHEEPVQRQEDEEMVMIQTGGWMSSLPVLGRFWGTKKKTFVKKSEFIV